MALRVERDPAFWAAVLAHPQVAQGATVGRAVDIAAIVCHPQVLPLRAEHGGFLVCALDPAGWLRELHSLFTPEGWGREVNQAAKALLVHCFAEGMQGLVTYEASLNPRSRPPLSFGFQPMGDFTPAPHIAAELRGWILTRRAWEGSPAAKRMKTQCP